MRLCHLDDLPDGDARGFNPHGDGQHTLLVLRQGRQLWAYADVCPHHGTPMAWRRHAYLNAARDRIVCAAHGAQFDIASGVCTLGPCLGDALTAVPLVLHDSGEVHLADPNLADTATPNNDPQET